MRRRGLPWGVPIVVVALGLLVGAVRADAGDRASVAFSLERNELRSQRIALVRELKDVDQEIAAGEKPVTVSGTVARARTLHGMRASHVTRLRNQRERLLNRIDAIERRFDTLTDRVIGHYGERPVWWRDLD